MKYVVLLILALCLLIDLSCSKTDRYAVNRAVKLTAPKGQCSGEQITYRGKTYVLTAGHCKGLLDATLESGAKFRLHTIAEDPSSDLLLLSGVPGLSGLELGDSLERGDSVATFTHGHGMPTYKTAGILINAESKITVPISLGQCPKMQKFKTVTTPFGDVCALEAIEAVMTAPIVPGSSGGMVVNSSYKLVGVVSASDGAFGYIVPLKDVKRFLRRAVR